MAHAILCQIQLALRHPGNKGPMAEMAKKAAQEIQRGICDRIPELQPLLEAGWNPQMDVDEEGRRVVEVHNVYTLYELNSDGSRAENGLLSFSRPQDWGDSQRWHYRFCKISVVIGSTHYINNCHLWQEVERPDLEAYQIVSQSLFMILQPGTSKELCSRSHLDIDDFWENSWGEMPPYYNLESDEDYEQDYQDSGEYVDPVPVGGKIYSWRIYHPLQPRRQAENDALPIKEGYQWQYLINADDEEGGFLIATIENKEPLLHELWKERGWQIKFHSELEKIAQ